MSRPLLPVNHLNPHIKATLNSGVLPTVKYQILTCEGKEILVGRLKIETPTTTGHAFILRRYDTGGVSLTSMFRAAFPTAPDECDREEAVWVKENFDLANQNGSPRSVHIARLAGVWVSPKDALELGTTYGLGELIHTVVHSQPDPDANYRRSQNRSQPRASTQPGALRASAQVAYPPAATVKSPKKAQQPVAAASRSSPGASSQGPAKRRKEESPQPAQSAPASVRGVQSPPSSRIMSTSPSKVPLPRRSTRTKSPAPKPPSSSMQPFTALAYNNNNSNNNNNYNSNNNDTNNSNNNNTIKSPSLSPGKPKSPTKTRDQVEMPTPAASDEAEAVVDDDDNDNENEKESVVNGVMGSPLHLQDVREQQKLIADLKAQRAAARVGGSGSGDLRDEDHDMEEPESSGTGTKRTREASEERIPVSFNFREPGSDKQAEEEAEQEQRVVVSNSRVRSFMSQPGPQSVAWGVVAFAFGMGVISFLPNIF